MKLILNTIYNPKKFRKSKNLFFNNFKVLIMEIMIHICILLFFNLFFIRVIVTTCLTHIAPPQLKIFRNYELETSKLSQRQKEALGYDNPALIPIWKAARCSRCF